jgi:hypothetical protein
MNGWRGVLDFPEPRASGRIKPRRFFLEIRRKSLKSLDSIEKNKVKIVPELRPHVSLRRILRG